MQLSVFEMVKRGVSTIIEVVDAFARTELVRLENLINNLATVARTGSYNDLTDKPVIPTPPELSEVAYTGEYNDLLNKPALFSGNYNDLTNKPTIPTKTSDLINDSGFISGAPIAVQYVPIDLGSVGANSVGTASATISDMPGYTFVTAFVLFSGAYCFNAYNLQWVNSTITLQVQNYAGVAVSGVGSVVCLYSKN